MSLAEDRDKLAQILRTRSVRRGGEYRLASGRISDVYCDARVTTCRAEAMPLIGRLYLAKMADRGWKPKAVGGLTMGADPIVIAVSRESVEAGPVINAFLVRKEAKGHGMKRQIEGLTEAEAGIDVVIVDDVCTTGDSTVKAIQAAREAGLNVLGAICLVDREEGGRENIEAANVCPFDRIFAIREL
jgi:orotate phosphoribosyltransferase